MKIKTLIVDDEPLAHKVLQSYCDKIDLIEIVGNCYDGMSTINFLSEQKVDLVLLDIQMPDLTGLEVLSSLRNSPKVIFTTAYSEFAVDGYDFEEVVDYLLKPVALPRFIKAINRAKKILDLEANAAKAMNLDSSTQQVSEEISFINLSESGTVHRIALKDILYIQSWGNYIKLYMGNAEVKLFRMTFKQLLTMLPESRFLRIHKSYIVNLEFVVSITRNQLLLNEDILPIGKSYSMLIKGRLK